MTGDSGPHSGTGADAARSSPATVVIAGYVSDTFSNDLAWALFGGIVAAYVLSRGIAKAGSKEGPFIVRGDTAEQ
jgi:hypothetical protein